MSRMFPALCGRCLRSVDLATGNARLEARVAVLVFAPPPEPRPAEPAAAEAVAVCLEQLQQALVLRFWVSTTVDRHPAGGRQYQQSTSACPLYIASCLVAAGVMTIG